MANQPKPRRPKCSEVYQWPEFKALCERLGVEWSRETVSISIIMDKPDEEVIVVQSYYGSDHRLVQERTP